MTQRRNDKDLTELEGAALGVIIREGPVTSFAVKELFRASPSEYWSGSAGAMYPLMRRLETRKLVVSKDAPAGRRKRRVYRATSKGRHAFQSWLSDAERAAAMGFDPLRTRLVFFDLLSAKERNQFKTEFDACIRHLQPPPGGAPGLETLHHNWNRARSEVFEQFIKSMERDDK